MTSLPLLLGLDIPEVHCGKLRTLAGRYQVVLAGDEPGDDLPVDGPLVDLRELLPRLPRKPDLVLARENGSHRHYLGLDALPCPGVWWVWDTHLVWPWARYYAGAFDAVLAAQRDHLPPLAARWDRSFEWLPWFADMTAAQVDAADPAAERDIDLAFVGNMGAAFHDERRRFFDALAARLGAQRGGGLRTHFGPGDWRDIYPRARIVVDENQGDDLHPRSFEAMACGCLLLAPRIPNGLEELFQGGRDLVLVGNRDLDEVAAKAAYWLAHPEDRVRVARSGQAKVRAGHLTAHRMATLARFLDRVRTEVRPSPGRASERRYALGMTLLRLALRPLSADPREWEQRVDRRLAAAEELLRSASQGRIGLRARLWAGYAAGMRDATGDYETARDDLQAAAADPVLQPMALSLLARLHETCGRVALARQAAVQASRASMLAGTQGLAFDHEEWELAGMLGRVAVERGPDRVRWVRSEPRLFL